MKKHFSFLILGAALHLGLGLAQAGELIITSMQGEVNIQKSQSTLWKRATTGQVLKSGDKIRTGKKSQASTTSREGHRITIKEKTVFQISQLGPAQWDFEQEAGKSRLSVAKMGRGQSLRVRTPTAVCAVRGTEFEITVLEDRSTILDVFQGLVAFSDPAGTRPEIPVAENQRSSIEQGSAPKEPEPIPAQEGAKEEQPQDQKKDPDQRDRKKDEPGRKDEPGKKGEEGRKDDPGRRDERGREGREERAGERTGDRFSERGTRAEDRDRFGDRERLADRGRTEREGERAAGDARFGFREPFGDPRDEFRRELEREVRMDLYRDGIESDAAFEIQANQYQDAKTLIDAFGQRVRLEEYVTRPTPESFKYVALNTRADRFDFAFFEVVANRPLPRNLDEAGNLWFAVGDKKPEFFAVKQRWFASNQKDSVTQMDLDGDSREVTFQEPQFADDGTFRGVTNLKGFKTVFDHRYSFINGNPDAVEKAWSDSSFRPADNGALAGLPVTGMMWHMRPVLVEQFDPARGVTSSFWQDTFVTGQGAGATASGKMVVVQHEPDADPFRAHFTEKQAYINFVDSNANGRLDPGERFADLNRNGTRDADEPFADVVQLGLNGTKDLSRTFNGTGDSGFFSDLNRDGLDNDGASGRDPFIVAQKPWASAVAENFMVTDLGEVLSFKQTGVDPLSSTENKDALAETLEKVNFERVWTSSEFGGRKIDVVLTPRILLKAGMIQPKIRGKEPADGR